MSLTRLTVENVRNLRTGSLSVHPRLNIIVGPNGSGKTSLLEAIFILGRARSFRDSKIANVISLDQETARVSGVVETSHQGQRRKRPLGIEWDRKGGRRVRADGEAVHRSSDLSDVLPLSYVGLEETRLLSNEPLQRRRFLDWAMFHVEHRYREFWQRYERALRQRNAVLKQKRQSVRSADVDMWDRELISSAQEIDSLRREYLVTLVNSFRGYLQGLSDLRGENFSIRYQPGWAEQDGDLTSCLENQLRRDGERGFTQSGPHRADFMIYRDNASLQSFASAGEQKVAVCALFLAQWDVFRVRTGREPLVLIDDLPAELDEQRRRAFFELALSLSAQVFVTATELNLLAAEFGALSANDNAVFHVEHGQVSSPASS